MQEGRRVWSVKHAGVGEFACHPPPFETWSGAPSCSEPKLTPCASDRYQALTLTSIFFSRARKACIALLKGQRQPGPAFRVTFHNVSKPYSALIKEKQQRRAPIPCYLHSTSCYPPDSTVLHYKCLTCAYKAADKPQVSDRNAMLSHSMPNAGPTRSCSVRCI